MNSKAPGYLGSVWPDENPCQYISYDYLKNQQCAVYFVFLYYYHYIHLQEKDRFENKRELPPKIHAIIPKLKEDNKTGYIWNSANVLQ